ncbi:unnamed protein product [Urochloa humidicola]
MDMEQQLCRLRQHVFLLAPCASPAAMAGALEGVARVYEHAAESMARADQVDGELEASVALLDACAAARDAFGAMRACALDAEAAARRRDVAAAGRAARACARQAKCACADARRLRRRAGGSGPEHGAASGGGVHELQEARRLTVAVLERVAAAMSRRVASAGGGAPRPANGWSTFVAKAFRKSARVACEATLPSLPSKDRTHDGGEAALRVQREMRALGDTIQQLEDGLELLFRRLVQCRVFLLNMRSCSVKV